MRLARTSSTISAAILDEEHHLAASEPDRVGNMKAALQQWRIRVGARLPEPNPNYDPQGATELGKPGNAKRKEINE